MTERRARRGGGHAGHARGEAAAAIRQMPWRIPLNPDRPTEPLPPEGVAAIHDAAMRVLEEIGIDFLNDEARDYLAGAGCARRAARRPCGWTAASSWSRWRRRRRASTSRRATRSGG